MAPGLQRALSSTLLLGAILQCAATDAGEPAVQLEATMTIPKDGLEAHEQKVVWLGPLKALRVVDSSNAAVFMPQSIDEPLIEPSSEHMNAIAYAFENGACDFGKTVKYQELFPAYEKPLWVRTTPAKSGAIEGESPAPVANYTFTSPPAEVLSGVSSFCVRFRVKSGDQGETESDKGTPPAESVEENAQGVDQGGVGGLAGAPARKDEPEKQQEDAFKNPVLNGPESKRPKKVDAVNPKPQLLPSPAPPQQAGEEPDHTVEGGAVGNGLVDAQASSALATKDNEQAQAVAGSHETVQSGQETPKQNPQEDADQLSSGKDGGKQARLRRLSAPAVSQDKYLTIIVHSAAWGTVSRVAATSAAVMAAAASLLPVF
ncbi:Toxoplasma gondii family A protein [Besnoitia besnoiti]|uniref:Toxoplasma gondii family A protein n=1 Tax=Besnoitia besnoiti TaxID=94643 RepID=A0A2A9MLW1_BESBE|nr:Toxoplasma gondii family A protein [Besnoitia besnoiti]PFH36733.1 Toxoplasma gondii family A protein [Besnoitia besnoiti]